MTDPAQIGDERLATQGDGKIRVTVVAILGPVEINGRVTRLLKVRDAGDMEFTVCEDRLQPLGRCPHCGGSLEDSDGEPTRPMRTKR